ncbi:hypothetical protein AB0B88_16155 [Micromonospora haikouensis]|uniref:hypothetical protein n=1 Tax=Micromonospora haikouensis TaxID=686309 RepID=UPI003400C9EC
MSGVEQSGGVDPSVDPEGYVGDLIRQYIKPGTVEAVIRTVVPIAVGGVLAWVAANYNLLVPEGASSTVVVVVTGAVTAGYYTLARALEQRFPRLGRWLIAFNLVKARPLYAPPAVAGAAEGRHRAADVDLGAPYA